jgi:hypothetical protein
MALEALKEIAAKRCPWLAWQRLVQNEALLKTQWSKRKSASFCRAGKTR